jgi:hypothetical protein
MSPGLYLFCLPSSINTHEFVVDYVGISDRYVAGRIAEHISKYYLGHYNIIQRDQFNKPDENIGKELKFVYSQHKEFVMFSDQNYLLNNISLLFEQIQTLRIFTTKYKDLSRLEAIESYIISELKTSYRKEKISVPNFFPENTRLSKHNYIELLGKDLRIEHHFNNDIKILGLNKEIGNQSNR